MPEKKTAVLSQLIDLLEPLNDEERTKTVNAALTFLGAAPIAASGSALARPEAQGAKEELSGSSGSLPQPAGRWLKQYSIEADALENVFHFGDNGFEIIVGDVPGKSKSERTRQCYLLSGIKNLLQDGRAKIDDEQARQLCRDMGCYDATNHTGYVKELGNALTGNKKTGMELTAPGLRVAADLVKSLTAA